MFSISNKGFIPDTCLLECVTEFSYLDKFLRKYQNQEYQSFDDFRKEIQDYEININETTIKLKNLTESQLQKIYSVTSILSHLYVWGGETQNTNIPECIGVPWYLASQELGIPPVLTHAAVDLFNWKLINPILPFSLENIEPIHLFNLDPEVRESEKWFYLPMIAIEGECGCILHKMEEIYEMLEQEENSINTEKVKTNLKFILQKLTRQYEILQTTERCDPEHFYHLIRPYLGGSKQKDSPGWYLEGIERYIEYGGGSAAQSSLIQAEDIFLGVEHPGDDFLKSMRDYMPEPHKQYLEHQETRPSFPEMRQRLNSEDYESIEELRLLCVEQIKHFRRYHYGIVQRYVMRFNSMIGTGGTDVNRNLRHYINNTINAFHNLPVPSWSIAQVSCGDVLVAFFWLCYLYLVYWYFTSPAVDKLLRDMYFPE